MDPNVLAQTAVEHHDEPELLRGVNDLFGEEKGHSLERIRPALAKTIEGLRRHMAQEEAELFPVLERTLAGQHAGEPPPGDLHETMTVNQVLQQFPQTRRIFDRLFINVPMEGCTCLDEVAWCHGMEARELMDRLKEAVAQHEVSAAGG
jgi:iron-sulfur cluster repair protein YtfE (RIC family)